LEKGWGNRVVVEEEEESAMLLLRDGVWEWFGKGG